MRHSAFRPSVLVLVLLVTPGAPFASGADGEPVALGKTWDGEVKIALRDRAPGDGYVADKAAWEKLWKSYQPDAKVPEIDFAKELVLVAVNRDPNQISISATLDAGGNLTVRHASTKIGFPNPETCKYQFAAIKREGIKTINGKPLGGK